MNANQDIRKEEVFLLGLCRLDFEEELVLKLRSMAEEISDWKYFGSLAGSHGVAALVYDNLEKLDLLRFAPAETIDFLRNSLFASMSRNVRLTEMMKEVLQILNMYSIKTVLLKGMALEPMVYGNRGLRQMTDMDILVAGEDCLKARNVLINNGFSSLPLKSAFYKIIISYTGKHLPSLIKNGLSVDIHHELFGAGKNAMTRMLYDSSIEKDLAGEKVFIPGPQIFFLYLVKHLYLHEMNNESQLRLYTDLVVLKGKYNEDIINSDLVELAKLAGMSEILACRLEFLREFWEISFPGLLNDFINEWHDQSSMNKFIFFLKSPKDNPPIYKALVYRNQIKDIPGFHRKFIFILGDLFPTKAWMKKRYRSGSAWKALLYYPHRFGKLMFLLKGSKAQRLRGSKV